jgi:antitoxin (DNA-binding transcriptional repressor) of toxin-antitoxin stability system
MRLPWPWPSATGRESLSSAALPYLSAYGGSLPWGPGFVCGFPTAILLTQSGKSDILIIRFMKKTSITVTEASRNFADCVNRAHYQNVTFVLLKNGEPVARLVPDNEKVCVGRDLAEALAKNDLSANEARAWHRDLEAARKSLKAPADKWR